MDINQVVNIMFTRLNEKLKIEIKEQSTTFLPAQIANEMFTKWNDTLQTKDNKQVAAMYSDDSTFLPTLSGELKRGATGAVEYFEHFLTKNPFGTIVESAVQQSADGGTVIYSGLYDFELGPEDAREKANARFTYIFQKNDADEWKIIHHHSSLKPE